MADALAALIRLRRLEAQQATRDLAAAVGAERQAEATLVHRRAACEAAFASPLADPAHPLAALAATWHPVAAQAIARATAALERSAQGVDQARLALAARSGALDAARSLADRRAAEAARVALRKAQGALDEVARRQGGRRRPP